MNVYAAQIHSAASAHSTTALNHVEFAYKHYISLPHHQQQEIWQIELARAFISEKQKREETEERLETLLAEARQLNGQVEYLSRCQWPREMALWPPERRPIRRNVIKVMESRPMKDFKRRKLPDHGNSTDSNNHQDSEAENSDSNHWDYNTLVGKWKKAIREDAVRQRGLTLPVPVPVPPLPPINNKASSITNTNHTPSTTTNRSPQAPTQAAPSTQPSTKDPHFEPWSKKPKLLIAEDRIIGLPASSKQATHQQQQQQQQRHSSLREIITDSKTPEQTHQPVARDGRNTNRNTSADGGGGGGRVFTYSNGTGDAGHAAEQGRYGNVIVNGNGNKDT
jgi:hypothetical protein